MMPECNLQIELFPDIAVSTQLCPACMGNIGEVHGDFSEGFGRSEPVLRHRLLWCGGGPRSALAEQRVPLRQPAFRVSEASFADFRRRKPMRAQVSRSAVGEQPRAQLEQRDSTPLA